MRIPIAFLIALLPFTGTLAQETESSESGDSTMKADGRPDPAMPQGENLQRPEGWQVRLDEPDPTATIGAGEEADIYFVNMTPGWHITTHKSAIFYHPASTAKADFTAKTAINLFDPGNRDREAFGLFVGGKNLDGDAQEYTYFLLRNTGDFLIKRRSGSETSVISDWTHTDAMKVHPHEGTDSVLNELAVRAGDKTVHFLLNGTEVATLPRAEAHVDGIVGLRVNHGLNLHVSDLSVETHDGQ